MRKRLVQTLIVGIIVDVDKEARVIILMIHWPRSQRSPLSIRNLKSCKHGCRTPDESQAVIRSMTGKRSDEHFSASLNRMCISILQRHNMCIRPQPILSNIHQM